MTRHPEAARLAGALLGLLTAVPVFAQHPDMPVPTEAQEESTPAPKILFRGFGDVNFKELGDGRPNTFAVGELSLMVTSELSDDLSFLSEIVFEPGEGEERVVDVERYQLKYSPSDLFNVAVGRMHTTLGHWNRAYHHGAWFQTTAFRPEMYRFEDEGGVLPVHEVGLQLFGAKDVRSVRLEYNLSVANGRGKTPDEVVLFRDHNRSKALNLWLGVAPRRVTGLKFGGVIRTDTIPADSDHAGRDSVLDERILGGFAVFQRSKAEFLAEVVRMRHGETATGRRFTTLGYYLQGAYGFGPFKPYYRFEILDRGEGDPYYPSAPDVHRHTGGVRIDPRTWACIKVEVGREHLRPGGRFGTAAAQVAFTF